MIKQTISFEKDEFKKILIDYLYSKGFENISSVKVTIGSDHSYDFVTGNGYTGVKLEVETTKEECL